MSEVNSLTAAAVTNVTLTFLAFMPRPADVLKAEGPQESQRVNEASAAVVGIGLGIALSFVAKSGAPLIASIVAVTAMVAGYEYLAQTTDARLTALRTERTKNVAV